MSEGVGLGRPLSVVREELLADEETRVIARTLGMELEDYVELVLDYAQNPSKEPQVEVVPDDELPEGVPKTRDVVAWLEKVGRDEINLGPHEFTSDFDDEEVTASETAARVAIAQKTETTAPGREAPKGQVFVDNNAPGQVLKQQLLAEANRARHAMPRHAKKKSED